MNLDIKTTKTSQLFYVVKSYRDVKGKSTSKIVEKLGTYEELKSKLHGEDPVEWAKNYVRELNIKEKDEKRKILVEFSPSIALKPNEQSNYNGGYLLLQKIYHELGLNKICETISKKYKNEYDLNDILSMLLYTRVLYPGSKLSSLEDAQRFIEQPKVDIHQIYRALSLLSKESDMIQASVYKNSLNIDTRNSKVIYYDCTNYFFESEAEFGLRQYGASKEHRPNPIVQMGMFMDMDGMPLAFCINPGNTNEQITLKPLENKLKENFGISKMVVCTDCGLSSYENRKNNNIGERAFITVQSLKKLKKHLQDWSLESTGWRIEKSKELYDISKLDATDYYDTLFYKDRWINENGLEQRIIVTFSFKYRDYLEHVRDRQVERAQLLIRSGASRINKKNNNNCKRFIEGTHVTIDGEVAQTTSYSLNQEMIGQEARFDGFYAICTDIEDDPVKIIKVNGGRWIIENGFRMMKSDFEARPVFLQRDDRIKAHFLTCFLALLLYKYLEKRLNQGKQFKPNEIIGTLVDMNFLTIAGEGYIPTYTRTDITDALHGVLGQRTDNQIVTKQKMRTIISSTKNIRKKKK